MKGAQLLDQALPPSPYPSPRGGLAQIFKIEDKIDGFIPLKIEKMSPKRTFWAKPPEGEGNKVSSSTANAICNISRASLVRVEYRLILG